MRPIKILALVNGLVAATVVVTLAALTEVGLPVTPQMVVDASKGADPAFGLDLLSRGVSHWHHRADLYSYICYGLVLLLAIDALFMAAWQHNRPAR
jgi:hypothetical protein